MDTRDLFKKFTIGCNFKGLKGGLFQKLQPKTTTTQVRIKDDPDEPTPKLEIKEEFDEEPSHNISSVTIKEETSDDDRDVNVFGNEIRLKRKRKSEKVFDEKKRAKLEEERINHYRNVNHIRVVGRHVAAPVQDFEELPISKDLKESLKNFGYAEPTGIQKQAIPIMLSNRQILACAPTGSGKTIAFLVPIIQQLRRPRDDGVRALIIAPTRELAKQIQRECKRLAVTRALTVTMINKTHQVKDKTDILVSTPNRLCYLLKQDPCPLSLANVKWLIIDEADKLFEDGVRSFRNQLTEILAACSNKKRRMAMFSATFTPAVAYWCRHNMQGLITVTIGHRNSAVTSVDQKLLFVGNDSGKLLALRDMIKTGIPTPCLVFVQSKDRAKQLHAELMYDDVLVDVIHADRTQTERDNTIRAFREGNVWILICTELMARGLDFKGVNLVINFDFPPSSISYVHRIGRTGRAGRGGQAITYFTVDDRVNLRSIAHIIKDSGGDVPEYMLKLKQRGKKHRKKLLVSAPKREDIRLVPSRRAKYAVEEEKFKKKKRRVKIDGEKSDKKPGKMLKGKTKAVSKGKKMKKRNVMKK